MYFLSFDVCALKLFQCRFMPLIAPNPGDAIMPVVVKNLGRFVTGDLAT